MATTKIWAIKDSISRVVKYAENPNKTRLAARITVNFEITFIIFI